jgi:hypothetical protein
MKVLTLTSNFLKNKARKNFILTILCVTGTFIIILISIPSLPTYVDVGNYEAARGTFSLLPFIIGILFWRKYRTFQLGYEGEKQVAERLASTLSNDYHMINDSILPSYNRGNIDHIVISPQGVFAIETKNHRGKITYFGEDEWLIQYRGKNKGSTEREFNLSLGNPSVQARSNAKRVKKVIDSIEQLVSKRVWVQGIVVFSNNSSELRIKQEQKESVDIMTLNDLPNYLKTYLPYPGKELSIEEIELIENEIIRQSKKIQPAN